MEQIKVKDLMSSQARCIAPETPLADVAETMAAQRFSCMVIGEEGQPSGILTERDLVKALLASQHQQDLLQKPVANFMSSPVITLNLNESLYEAIVVAKSEKVRHLPVVDDMEQLQGIVTQSNIAEAHFRVVEMQSDLIEQNIAAKTEVLRQANEQLQALSLEDHLMQIGNRRAMEVDLQRTHSASLRYQRSYSIALLDIDFFKLFNDHYGHARGDDALKQVAQTIKGAIRTSDRIYRYGGEELLVLFPESNLEDAELVSERLIKKVYELNIAHQKSEFDILTISAGTACFCAESDQSHWNEVLKRADSALYRAKSAGRNQLSSCA
ncbi:MAG: GGDEF domain-containing protein [Motiliproteus sp.]|nr:GGDEF domain-containing protein [Motiliproteus sp.]MCW9053898.1 GGDEF domain-containing protein [Motiliproteus sp.]